MFFETHWQLGGHLSSQVHSSTAGSIYAIAKEFPYIQIFDCILDFFF